MDGSTSSPQKALHWAAKPQLWLALFVVLNLIVGVFIAGDYGESTDEAFERERAVVALKMYSGADIDREQVYTSLGVKRLYGTAQTAFFQYTSQKLSPLLHVPVRTITHYGYFVTFQVAVVAIFYLTRSLTNPWTALATSVIFGTQPLLFGHAFINPKDIPQMAIFTATVAAGFLLSEKMAKTLTADPLPIEAWRAAIRDKAKWQKTFSSTRWMLGVVLFLGAFLLTAHKIIPPLVSWMYQAPAGSLVGWLFGLIGDNSGSIPLSDYVNKGQVVSVRLASSALIGWAGLYLFVFGWRLLSGRPRLLDLSALWASLRCDLKEMSARILWGAVLAGGIWGLAVATRVTGLAAGGIVGLCLLLEFRRKAIFPLILYTLAAALVCYAAWPFLWVFGLEGLFDALQAFSSNVWGSTVLFEGELYTSTSLPRDYLLKMLSLQLTLPVVFLSVGGFFLGLFLWKKKTLPSTKFWLLVAWFALPVLYTVLKNSSQYNNFRQYLFVLPPLFVFTGIFLDWLRTRLPWKALLPALTLVFVLPAVFSIVQLHPYQYIYYNALTGGVEGAFREYPLDYWLTSYQDTAAWVDENIPPGSTILVWGGRRRIEPFVKNEYTFISNTRIDPATFNEFDYVIIPTEQMLDLQYNTETTPIFSIEWDNVPLVFVKEN